MPKVLNCADRARQGLASYDRHAMRLRCRKKIRYLVILGPDAVELPKIRHGPRINLSFST